MRPRITFGNFMIRLGSLIQSLAISVMKPDDLMEFSKRSYLRPNNLNGWSDTDWIDSGLTSEEEYLLENIPLKKGKLLILCLGGGREAISFAKKDFEITGVDFVPEMIEKARKNLIERDIDIEYLVQNMSELDVPAETYDLVWLSASMYSCIPTRKRRIAMLKRINKALKSGGYFAFAFHADPSFNPSRKAEIVKRIFAVLTLGNLSYEKGDRLWGSEFLHNFISDDEIHLEADAGGFDSKIIRNENILCGAILKKR